MCENDEVANKGLTLYTPAQAKPEKQGLCCTTHTTCENGDMGLRKKRYYVNTLMRKSGKKDLHYVNDDMELKVRNKRPELRENGDVKIRGKDLHYVKLVTWKEEKPAPC